MKIDTKQSGLAFIPGPKQISSPYYSTEIQDISEYKPKDIEDSFKRLERFEVLCSANPSWWEWRGIWYIEQYEISINITCLGEQGTIWGGSELSGICRGNHILRIWHQLLSDGFSSVYLHNNECRMFTLEEFKTAFSGKPGS